MSNALAKREPALPEVPARADLEALSPADLWTLEERATEIQDACRALNDERLRCWVEEGKTQTEMAQMVGRSTSQISRRCAALGIESSSNRGRPRISPTGNSCDPDDAEEVDGEVVEEPEPAKKSRGQFSNQAGGSDAWESKVEVKRDFKCWREPPARGNVAIEFEQHGTPSGVAATTAHRWAIEFDQDCWLLLPTERVKDIARRQLKATGPQEMGDNGNVGVLVPIEKFVKPDTA